MQFVSAVRAILTGAPSANATPQLDGAGVAATPGGAQPGAGGDAAGVEKAGAEAQATAGEAAGAEAGTAGGGAAGGGGAVVPLREEPAYEKYFRMVARGVPREAVQHQVRGA